MKKHLIRLPRWLTNPSTEAPLRGKDVRNKQYHLRRKGRGTTVCTHIPLESARARKEQTRVKARRNASPVLPFCRVVYFVVLHLPENTPSKLFQVFFFGFSFHCLSTKDEIYFVHFPEVTERAGEMPRIEILQ